MSITKALASGFFIGTLVLACTTTNPISSTEGESAGGCTPGDIYSCFCGGSAMGTQICAQSGDALGPCDCSAASTGGAAPFVGTGGVPQGTGGIPPGTGAAPSTGGVGPTGGAPGTGAVGGFAPTGGAGGAGFGGAGGQAFGGLGGAAFGGAGGVDMGGAGGVAFGGAGGVDMGGAGGVAIGGSGGAVVVGEDPTQASASTTGPYTVEQYSSGYADSPDYAAATIYYPGNGTPPYAGVAISPGWLEGPFTGWGTFLASHGYVTIPFAVNSPSGDQPSDRALALMAAVETLRQENTRQGSPVLGLVDVDRMAIMGHSMGGGGTLIAANTNSGTLRAAVPLCPWSSSPKSFPGITVPTLIIAGQLDSIAGVSSHAWPFYQSLSTGIDRMYAEFAGGDHFVANEPTNGTAARYALSWLKVYVNDDTRYAQFLVDSTEFSRFAP